MTLALNVYNVFDTFSRVPAGRVNEWMQQNGTAADIFKHVMELRIKHGYYRTATENRN